MKMPTKRERTEPVAADKQIVHIPGVERVVAVIDCSGSMEEKFEWEDGPAMSRLECVTEAIHMIIDASSRAVCRFGLVKFSTHAEVLCPITDRFTAVKIAASELQTDSSTNYARGLTLALNMEPNRIILLSDGEAGDTAEALKLAYQCARNKIKIDTVGIGNRGLDLLKKIAEITGGVYFFALSMQALQDAFMKLETRARLQLEHKEA